MSSNREPGPNPGATRRERRFRIAGMDCAEEVAALKSAVGPVVGGDERLAFDILGGTMFVSSMHGTDAAIVEAVGGAGLRAEILGDGSSSGGNAPPGVPGRLAATVSSGVALAAGFATHALVAGSVSAAFGSEGLGDRHEVPVAARVIYGLAIASGCWLVLPKAWAAARRARPDMNLLMTVAVGGAVGIGEWFEAATVAFLFALSGALEAWSLGRARRAIEALMKLAPPVARLLKDGVAQEVALELVPVGSTVVVRPGEKVPLDGKVLRGTGAVNQAPITGESMPVTKTEGSEVFAGTINGDAALEIRTTKPAGDSTLAHIIRMVGEASRRRAPSEQWVERFARWYTPAILIAALAVLLAPPLLFGGAWTTWIYRSLVLLLIGCPCALVISTPVSIVSSLAAAARNGVLVKGGIHMETASRLKAIAFDKTGTLTLGRPGVAEVVPLSGHSHDELVRIVAGIESLSDHPLARAILEYAAGRGVAAAPAENVRIMQGKGASGVVDGMEYWAGSHRYLEERGQETPEIHERLEQMTSGGRSAVVVGNSSHVCGLIAVADAVRPDARPAIEALRREGIAHVIMLSGDNAATARAVAAQAGVEEVRAELLPADKVTAIEALARDYGTVAMVGDGVNDAPAMALATLGIAMGACGSDAAIETADVALMSDDLSKLPWLVRHSHRTLRVIRQNIVLSLAIKAVFVALTCFGIATLWSAIAADMGVSLLVILNALGLLRNPAPRPAAGGRGAGKADLS